jgi:teichuronic acid biosynthesis glycosyltransferase TuaC
MRVLVITRIFPNSLEPERAPYNRRQFAELAAWCDPTIWALVPWFPFDRWFGHARRRSIPSDERIDGRIVRHPRMLYLPLVGRTLGGPLAALSLAVRAIKARGSVDVVLGAFAYPDGWAAVQLAKLLGVPAVVKVHGSDLHRDGGIPALREHVAWTVRHADAVVGPSETLLERARALGAGPESTFLVKNGVDMNSFHPRDRLACRETLGQPGDRRPRITFVGRMERTKGVIDLLDAFARLRGVRPDTQLSMVGDGEARRQCEQIAKARKLPVLFAGARPPDEIPLWVGASDVVALPSWSEGMPNAVVEAIACGRPVVATSVGAVPTLVTAAAGELVPPCQPQQLADALGRVLGRRYDPDAVVRSIPLDDWSGSAAGLHRVLKYAVDKHRAAWCAP